MQQCAPVFQYKSVDIMKNSSPFAAVQKTNLKIHFLFFGLQGFLEVQVSNYVCSKAE